MQENPEIVEAEIVEEPEQAIVPVSSRVPLKSSKAIALDSEVNQSEAKRRRDNIGIYIDSIIESLAKYRHALNGESPNRKSQAIAGQSLIDVESDRLILQRILDDLEGNSALSRAGKFRRFMPNVRLTSSPDLNLGRENDWGNIEFDESPLSRAYMDGLTAVVLDKQVYSGQPVVVWKSNRMSGTPEMVIQEAVRFLDEYYPLWKIVSEYWAMWSFHNVYSPPVKNPNVDNERKAGYTRFDYEIDRNGVGYIIDREMEENSYAYKIWKTSLQSATTGANKWELIEDILKQKLFGLYPHWQNPQAYWTSIGYNIRAAIQEVQL